MKLNDKRIYTKCMDEDIKRIVTDFISKQVQKAPKQEVNNSSIKPVSK